MEQIYHKNTSERYTHKVSYNLFATFLRHDFYPRATNDIHFYVNFKASSSIALLISKA